MNNDWIRGFVRATDGLFVGALGGKKNAGPVQSKSDQAEEHRENEEEDKVSDQNVLEQMVGRTQRLVDAQANALLTAQEVALERVEIAFRVGQQNARVEAFATIMEGLDRKRMEVETKLTEKGVGKYAKLMYTKQLEQLVAQQEEILEAASPKKHKAPVLALANGAGDKGA